MLQLGVIASRVDTCWMQATARSMHLHHIGLVHEFNIFVR